MKRHVILLVFIFTFLTSDVVAIPKLIKTVTRWWPVPGTLHQVKFFYEPVERNKPLPGTRKVFNFTPYETTRLAELITSFSHAGLCSVSEPLLQDVRLYFSEKIRAFAEHTSKKSTEFSCAFKIRVALKSLAMSVVLTKTKDDVLYGEVILYGWRKRPASELLNLLVASVADDPFVIRHKGKLLGLFGLLVGGVWRLLCGGDVEKKGLTLPVVQPKSEKSELILRDLQYKNVEMQTDLGVCDVGMQTEDDGDLSFEAIDHGSIESFKQPVDGPELIQETFTNEEVKPFPRGDLVLETIKHDAVKATRRPFDLRDLTSETINHVDIEPLPVVSSVKPAASPFTHKSLPSPERTRKHSQVGPVPGVKAPAKGVPQAQPRPSKPVPNAGDAPKKKTPEVKTPPQPPPKPPEKPKETPMPAPEMPRWDGATETTKHKREEVFDGECGADFVVDPRGVVHMRETLKEWEIGRRKGGPEIYARRVSLFEKDWKFPFYVSREKVPPELVAEVNPYTLSKAIADHIKSHYRLDSYLRDDLSIYLIHDHFLTNLVMKKINFVSDLERFPVDPIPYQTIVVLYYVEGGEIKGSGRSHLEALQKRVEDKTRAGLYKSGFLGFIPLLLVKNTTVTGVVWDFFSQGCPGDSCKSANLLTEVLELIATVFIAAAKYAQEQIREECKQELQRRFEADQNEDKDPATRDCCVM